MARTKQSVKSQAAQWAEKKPVLLHGLTCFVKRRVKKVGSCEKLHSLLFEQADELLTPLAGGEQAYTVLFPKLRKLFDTFRETQLPRIYFQEMRKF